MATLVQSGLPPGAAILVQDNLRRVTACGTRQPLIARSVVVPATGILVVDQLPDSNYALLFVQPALVGRAILSIDVGDRAAFPKAKRRPIPPRLILGAPVVTGRTVDLTWQVRADMLDPARVVAEVRRAGTSEWVVAAETFDAQARGMSFTLPLQSTNYDVRMKALNAGGRHLAASIVWPLTTGLDPNVPATLDGLADGTTYGRVSKTALDSNGAINLASDGIVNRGALALLNEVKSTEIAKDAVGTIQLATGAVDATKIADGAVSQAKIAANAVGSTQIASSAVTSSKIGSGAVGATQLASSVSSLTKVSGGILTAAGSTATLPAGKLLEAQAGAVKLKTFTAMPAIGSVVDGEWFAVTAGGQMGIYVRVGSVAMNGAGVTSSFSS